MLYVSTRNRTESYTAHRTLHEDRAPDGGMFVPFHLPTLTEDEIAQLQNKSFGDVVAYILNLFFSTQLTGWDVEFCCGRYPAKSIQLPHRLFVVEAWHNTASSYAYMERSLYTRLCGNYVPEFITNWAKVAIRIAVLFAVYCTNCTPENDETLDMAVYADAFIAPAAAWYARNMGLPIGMIICGSHDDGAVWDLLHRGETSANQELLGLERLIYHTLGREEALRFVNACGRRRLYRIDEESLAVLNDGFFAAVISSNRIPAVIENFNRTHDYVLDASAAISFGALQDYRSRTGESKTTLLISLSNPNKNAAEANVAGRLRG